MAGIWEIEPDKRSLKENSKYLTEFQTPMQVANYMASLIPADCRTILEPTKGIGNLVKACGDQYEVTAPDNFFEIAPSHRWDCVITNPPFSSKYAFGVPPELNKYGMRLGYHILTECMKMSDNVIALMPWFTLTDSDVRIRSIMRYGLISVTALPRATFQYARIQTVVLQMKQGYQGNTIFKAFELRNDDITPKLLL